jgi:hypothetical protein
MAAGLVALSAPAVILRFPCAQSGRIGVGIPGLRMMVIEMWLPALVCVAIVDVVVIVVWMAVVTDRQLIGADYRWGFSLKTLLIATAMVAINMAAVASFYLGRMD